MQASHKGGTLIYHLPDRSWSLFLVPTPYFGEEMSHVDAFGAHFYHPGVFEHAPGGGAAGGIFLETGKKKSVLI